MASDGPEAPVGLAFCSLESSQGHTWHRCTSQVGSRYLLTERVSLKKKGKKEKIYIQEGKTDLTTLQGFQSEGDGYKQKAGLSTEALNVGNVLEQFRRLGALKRRRGLADGAGFSKGKMDGEERGPGGDPRSPLAQPQRLLGRALEWHHFMRTRISCPRGTPPCWSRPGQLS